MWNLLIFIKRSANHLVEMRPRHLKVPCTSPSDGIGEEDEDCRDEEDREDDEDCQDVQDHEDVKYRDNVYDEIESELREANELGSRVANFEKEKDRREGDRYK